MPDIKKKKPLATKEHLDLLYTAQALFCVEFCSSSKVEWARIIVRNRKKTVAECPAKVTVSLNAQISANRKENADLQNEQQDTEEKEMPEIMIDGSKEKPTIICSDTAEIREVKSDSELCPKELIKEDIAVLPEPIKVDVMPEIPRVSDAKHTDFDMRPQEMPEPQKVKRCFLVDSENVANRWIPLLRNTDPEDRIILFYTENSPNLAYDIVKELIRIPDAQRLEWIDCFTGLNALDFQLVTELGCMIGSSRENAEMKYYILSNDHGYDAVCRYWNRKGIMVKRISALQDLENEIHIPAADSSREVINIRKAVPEEMPEYADIKKIDAEQTIQQQLESILLAVGVKNARIASQDIVDLGQYVPMNIEKTRTVFLKAYLGPVFGRSVSRKIEEKKGMMDCFYPDNLMATERKKLYMKKVLQIFGFSAKDVKVIAPSAPSMRKNNQLMNTHRKYLLKKYGPKEGKRKCEILETHLCVLQEL